MREVVERLEYLIKKLPEEVNLIPPEQMSYKLSKRWSKKEILGHLCDSATNNHHRFIKIQFETLPFVVVPYAQNRWVEVQDYQNMLLDEIVSFWASLNRQIVNVISKIPETKLTYLYEIGDNQYITLLDLIRDYLRHMDHHLVQIFGTADI